MSLLAGCAALVCGGCEQRFTNANLQVINHKYDYDEHIIQTGGKADGISPKEVESILGPPMKSEVSRMELETQKKELSLVRYTYQQDGQTIELHFLDNKLISKAPLLRLPGSTAKPTPASESETGPEDSTEPARQPQP